MENTKTKDFYEILRAEYKKHNKAFSKAIQNDDIRVFEPECSKLLAVMEELENLARLAGYYPRFIYENEEILEA